MRAIGRDPIFIERGEGAELLDVDGNRYVDYVCSWGPLIHGHAHPARARGRRARRRRRARASARRRRARSSSRSRWRGGCPAVEMLRMTSSGTEAAMTAIRLARAATGREQVLKFAGAYHGHVDGLLARGRLGPGHAGAAGEPRRPGERGGGDDGGRRWNDPEALIAATERHELAAIIAEPLPANMGLVPAARGLPRAAARARRRERGAARARRGDQRLSRRRRRRPGAARA